MKDDRYTKVVLTVIAAALTWICIRDISFVGTAQAQNLWVQGEPKEDHIKVRLYGYAGRPYKSADQDKDYCWVPLEAEGFSRIDGNTWRKARLMVPKR